MQFLGVLRVLGVLLVMFSTTLLPPILIALIGKDGGLQPFLVAYVTTLFVGGALWVPLRHKRRELRVRDGFLIVVLFWTVLALFGALPLLLSADLEISITDTLLNPCRSDDNRRNRADRP